MLPDEYPAGQRGEPGGTHSLLRTQTRGVRHYQGRDLSLFHLNNYDNPIFLYEKMKSNVTLSKLLKILKYFVFYKIFFEIKGSPKSKL